MLITVAVIVAVLLAAILVLAATKPATMEIRRTQTMHAPPERIFELVNDFHKWASWSPYEKLDPAMKRTFGGAGNGMGAVYSWSGNSKAGEGRMEIVDISPAAKVTIKLDFIRPFEGHNTAEFTMEPEGEFTNVTWAMRGPQAFMARIMCVFISMDKLVGKDFEAGLANMRTMAEQ